MTKDMVSGGELAALVESYELEINCGHCGWAGLRTLGWLGGHRDMICPTCRGVIVLNTSDRRRRIAALRRQVSALHEQLGHSIGSAESALAGFAAAARGASSGTPLANLGLWHRYGDGTRASSRDKRAARARR